MYLGGFFWAITTYSVVLKDAHVFRVSHDLLMVQRWMLHHKTALAGMEGGFSCWCYTKNVSSAFSHIISVGRTQKFLKVPTWLLFKKRFSFDFKRTEVN